MTQAHAFLFPGFKLQADQSLSEAELPPSLTRHLKSLRIDRDEPVSFLDGQGRVAEALCLSVKPYLFRVSSVISIAPARPAIHLLLSPPRRDTLSQTLSQAMEIGVSRISFLISEHNDYSQKERAPLVERSQRVLEASAEQCRAPHLPKLDDEWLRPSEALEALSGPAFFADEDLSRKGLYGTQDSVASIRDEAVVTLLIGPEGGWSPAERSLISAHPRVHPLGLGPRILKVPTACVAALYQLQILTRGARS
jgi:16S rRNA (uracil1498-N3)-methyltransferase